MCLSGESLASVKLGKKRPRKNSPWVVCWGLLTQVVCSSIINKLKAVAPRRTRGGVWSSSAGKILYKAGKAGLPGADPGPSVPVEVAGCHAKAFIRPCGWQACCMQEPDSSILTGGNSNR